ncbi:TPA: immunity 22 family protein [Burkholderia cenocepacia]|uniref:immunity 22 family protein n=1 Tax=Burkholderia cepacia complex TaxID=87882 RepID=UPI00087F7E6B|nr:immunity 22 family protein [Burkholderia cenocepacia]SDR53059.1 Immunity protein 22 [Burkholderia orbicola]MBR8068113.1 immunity 22 family protein [Burkholderia cenocepacia]MBR8196989.1 immunity 22 family protein [Burkholderia cenocepacia]MBR8446238.1 immunity 22 family protein [Burkholderia cenocepacia]MDS0845789.1 immunity 22 family protein [Burkholderia cenocepacia]
MEKANKVSVWVGKFTDDDDLTDYIENAYDENGDSSNQFRDDTGIDGFDDGFREADMLQPDLSLRENLVGFSWIDSFADVLIPQLEAMRSADDNGLILLYNFQYENAENVRPASRVRFVGTFDFQK